MLLLADEGVASTVASGGPILMIGLAAVTAISSAIGGYFAYRTTRDKLEFDAERVEMKKDIQHLKDKVESCHEERDQLEQRCESLERKDQTREAELADLRRRWDERSAIHKPLDRRKADDPNYEGPRTRAEDEDDDSDH